MATVSVVIPAAGAGMRFATPENKILQPLAGRAIFLRTIDLFAARHDVCQILLVLSDRDIETVTRRYGEQLAGANVSLAGGGPTRAQSVRNALARVDEAAALVCVHDAVRPCVTRAEIDAVFAAAEQTGAAILAGPVHGTVKQVSVESLIERTVCREGLWQAQTPQVFDKALLRAAYARTIDAVTDDAQVVEAAGHAITVVPGQATNIKITTPADLALAEAILRARPAGRT
ncbi:MAG: 2-C-methyl-D-erythritol 4-phosphate cytidylyltransferase [Phycisphaerae bacterium]|nr:2-C-methyl-D-erythritol 4-phosphate cytidylyltransferase [Phycisphaerae bacterium]